MRIIKIPIQDIQFIESQPDSILTQSIARIGLSFPIKVEWVDAHYHCLDGNKRLSALKILGLTEAQAIVMNNGNSRSNDCWRGRNHH